MGATCILRRVVLLTSLGAATTIGVSAAGAHHPFVFMQPSLWKYRTTEYFDSWKLEHVDRPLREDFRVYVVIGCGTGPPRMPSRERAIDRFAENAPERVIRMGRGRPHLLESRLCRVGWPWRALEGVERSERCGGGVIHQCTERHVFPEPLLLSGWVQTPFGHRRLDMPLRPIWPGFALNSALFAFAWAPIWFFFMGGRRAWRRRSGRCPKCAYDLKAYFAAGCPECGWNRAGEIISARPG